MYKEGIFAFTPPTYTHIYKRKKRYIYRIQILGYSFGTACFLGRKSCVFLPLAIGRNLMWKEITCVGLVLSKAPQHSTFSREEKIYITGRC
jgi:hypothetical protein